MQFYTVQRIENQLNRIQRNCNERLDTSWGELLRTIPAMYPQDLIITPSLLHGDLWAGNVGCADDKPCVFDCASFYGHSEFDLALAHMFGGFSDKFFRAYHELVPKAAGFEKRLKFYKLFHYLNHWNYNSSGSSYPWVGIPRECISI